MFFKVTMWLEADVADLYWNFHWYLFFSRQFSTWQPLYQSSPFLQPTSKKAHKRCSECTNLDSSLTKTVEETEEIIEEDTHVETESIESEEIEESGETSPHVSNLVCLNCAAVFRYKSSKYLILTLIIWRFTYYIRSSSRNFRSPNSKIIGCQQV